MKILHTADWHVGKVLKNQPRLDEHKAVLANLVRLADSEDVDVVVVAGDLFETSTPSPEAQGLVMRTLLRLKRHGRLVVVLAGNHDNPGLVDRVYRPVLGELGVHVLGYPKPAAKGTLSLTTRDGEAATVAVLPFLSARFAVRAAEVVLHESARHGLDYWERIKQFIDALTEGFTDGAVNIVTTHATLLGGRRGGGEREVQTLLGYELPASVFPSTAHYVALGHLHRYQEIDGPCPIAYSGSPIALDFGEEANESVALVVTATPGSRASIRPVPLVGGRPLRTLHGTLEQITAEAADVGDAYLRVVLAQQASAGLADLVRATVPNVLEVQIDPEFRPRPPGSGGTRSRLDRTPVDLFTEYLTEQKLDDPRVATLFAELLDEVST
jgi:DNA repair protein SbcD/Mre11